MSAHVRNLRLEATRLAFIVPEIRPYLLPVLVRPRVAKEFPTEKALKKYLEEHPGADRSQHSVKKGPEKKGPKKEDKGFDIPDKAYGEDKVHPRPKMTPSGWTEKDDHGNVYWGEKSKIVGNAQVEDSQIAGTISGDAKVEDTKTSVGTKITGDAEVRKARIEGLVTIKDKAKVSNSRIDAHNITIGGDTEIKDALIEGGDWDGQKVEGGRWKDSYDQEVIDILSQFNDSKNPFKAGSGDGAIRSMTRWMADGGRLKGLLGGKKKRKKIQKAIQEHMQYGYPGRSQEHAQEGAKQLKKLSDEDFNTLLEAAEKKAAEWKERKERQKGKKASMDDKALRKRLIRLASANPEIRPYVLPLLVTGKAPVRVASLRVGQSMENEKTMLRFQRWMSSIRVTDLTNAGKRGKKVDEFALYDLDRVRSPEEKKELEKLVKQLLKAKSYKDALKKAKSYVEGFEGMGPSIQEGSLKGVRVTPPGFQPIKLDTKHVRIESDYTDWTVFDKRDKANEPACMAEGRKSVKLFYRWLKDNMSKVQNMTFQQIVKALQKEGIRYHQWCRMD